MTDTPDHRPGESDLDRLARIATHLEADRDRWRRTARLALGVAIVALVGVLVLAPAVGWLARSLDQRNDSVSDLEVLVDQQQCTDLVEARFEDLIVMVVAAAIAEDDAALAEASAELAALGSLEESVGRCPP